MKRFIPILLCFFCFSPVMQGQYCIPTANCSDDDYVNNFSFNTISNQNSAGSNCTTNSYINTGFSTNVVKGSTYNFSVQSGSVWAQGFGIWIDFNKDNDFIDAGEFVYASPSASTNAFTGTITISTSASTGTTRMRVRSQYGTTITSAQSCSTFTYGETEDYTLNIQANNVPPVANFSASATSTCNGVVSFSDLSTNTPTGWSWNFGDGNTSTQQNPTNTYSSNGTYTVTLTATNSFGSDAEVKTNYITVNIGGGPGPANCTSATKTYCCGFGITNVTFNTINNSSTNASAGYQDFTCQFSTDVLGGQSYSLSVTANTPTAHNVRAWIDFNNDAIFTEPEELVFSTDSALVATGAVSIPPTAIVNTPLRMRVSANYWLANPLTSCDSIEYGQAEDYTVTVLENTNPPAADFSADEYFTCDGTVQFSDLSENIPIAWLWNFGDGSTSTDQNPTHTYTSSDTFTVTFASSNLYGTDTVIKPALIITNLNGQPIAPVCTPATLGFCCEIGIYNFTLSAINNTTSDAREGYRDFSCSHQATVIQGFVYPVSVQTDDLNPQDVKIWIDYNNDGSFNDTSEIVFSALNVKSPSGNITISSNSVINTPLRLRVSSDNVGNTLNSCSNPTNGQAEDYSLIIQLNNFPPAGDFTVTSNASCSGTFNFNDLSLYGTTYFWDFGDGSTSVLQNPSHTYSTKNSFTVTLIVCNANGCDTVTKPSFVYNINSPVSSCTPSTTSNCCGRGILNVTLASINNTSGDGSSGYMNYTCAYATKLATAQSYSLSVQTGSTDPENVRVWIDYNNSGTFQGSELVFQSTNKIGTHAGTITIPGTATLNTTLRMRVSSDWASSPLPQPCVNVVSGQVEDYSVIVVNPTPPVANFSFTTTSCSPTVQFTDNSTNQPSTWDWDFGDTTVSPLKNPSHTYFYPGTYAVTLIVTNPYGDDTLQQQVTVNFVTAQFTMSTDTVKKNDTVYFTDQSFVADSWQWNFGDGTSTSSVQNPVHAYSATGTYSVSLTATNSVSSCSAQVTKTIVVVEIVGENQFPVSPHKAGQAGYRFQVDMQPNPTGGVLHVNFGNNNKIPYEIYLFDAFGRMLFHEPAGKEIREQRTMDLAPLQDGVYYVKIQGGEWRGVSKVVKIAR